MERARAKFSYQKRFEEGSCQSKITISDGNGRRMKRKPYVHYWSTSAWAKDRRESLRIRFFSRLGSKNQSGCIEWQSTTDRYGYGFITFMPEGAAGGITLKAHRIAWEYANGSIPEGMHVLHKCDNPKCCNPDHLFLGTQLDNNRDMKEKNRNTRGNMRKDAKLNPDDVRRIRSMQESGIQQSRIAEHFGVSRSTVCQIVKRDRWAHVE